MRQIKDNTKLARLCRTQFWRGFLIIFLAGSLVVYQGVQDTLSAAELVSVNSAGTDSGDGGSRVHQISADGTFVLFESSAYDLGPTDTNNKQDIYVRDLQTGTTTLVSVNSSGTDSGNDGSLESLISADDRLVAFSSRASDLVTTDTNVWRDVFVRNLETGTTTLVSVNKDGTASGNSFSSTPSISADGWFVVFRSFASDLVPFTAGLINDVFVRDLQTGTTTLVSVNSAGTDSGNGPSPGGVISADGRFVAFKSSASDLGPTDTNNKQDIYVRELQTGTTTLVSVNSSGTDSGSGTYPFPILSTNPVISADGWFVAFFSHATDLVANDTNGKGDVFVRDLKTGTTTLVSVNSAGTDSGNDHSSGAVISPDGWFVAFHSGASDLVATDTNDATDVFVRDLQTGTTTLVSVNSAGTDSGNGSSSTPVISADGQLVAFRSTANDLGPTDTDSSENNFVNSDIFVRDLQAGTTTMVSVNGAGTDSGNDGSSFQVFQFGPRPLLSADGGFVVFDSKASDLVATDTNDTQDAFVFALPAISPEADVGDGVSIGEQVVIQRGVQIDDGATVGAGASIHRDASVGSDSVIGSGSIVKKDASVGDNVTVGSDVIIDDNVTVEDGACVGDGTHVGSGTIIGSNVVIGIDGSIGRNVAIDMNVMIGDNTRIPNGQTISSDTGGTANCPSLP